MSRPCSVCVRTDLVDIDAAIRSGISLRRLARRFGVSKSAAHRHRAHMSPAPEPPFELSLSYDEMEMARLPFTPSGRGCVRWAIPREVAREPIERPYDPLRGQW